MRKQDAATLKLFVSGLEGRWRENRDYFIEIQFTYTSGGSVLRGRAAREGICCACPSAGKSAR